MCLPASQTSGRELIERLRDIAADYNCSTKIRANQPGYGAAILSVSFL
jgi:hypothetical protein